MNLISLLIGLTIAGILATQATASFVHHNNLMALDAQVANLKTGLGYNGVPAAPGLDPTWTQVGTGTYQKNFLSPQGVLTVQQPALAGGNWVCSFSDAHYNLLRC